MRCEHPSRYGKTRKDGAATSGVRPRCSGRRRPRPVRHGIRARSYSPRPLWAAAARPAVRIEPQTRSGSRRILADPPAPSPAGRHRRRAAAPGTGFHRHRCRDTGRHSSGGVFFGARRRSFMPLLQCHLMSSSGRGSPSPAGPMRRRLVAINRGVGRGARAAGIRIPTRRPLWRHVTGDTTIRSLGRGWSLRHHSAAGLPNERPKVPDDARHDRSARGGAVRASKE